MAVAVQTEGSPLTMLRRRSVLQDHRLTEREQKNLELLEMIRQKGLLTRTELSRGTGFNIVTVSNYVSDFIKQGLVVERGFDVSTGGRKPILVELNATAAYAIGVDLGLMDKAKLHMAAIITDLRGTIVHRIVKPRTSDGMDKLLAQAGDLVRQLIKTSPVDPKKIRGAAIGVGGIVDVRAGTVRDTSHRGIRTSFLALQERWEAEFKLPILIGNDATLAGYGEYRLGLDRPVENMIYCYSDVGSSVILHGHIYWGSCGAAGEVGVFTSSNDDYLSWVKAPSFFMSNSWDLGLVDQAKKLLKEGNTSTITDIVQNNPDAITLEVIIQAAQAGDQLARELIEHGALQLGIRIASIVNYLNPEVVVIGGGIEKAGSLLLEAVWRAVRRYAYEEPASLVDVLPAKLGENAVSLGAACWVIREIFIQA
jgi:predicted NBD/HSP70 family sugar kinase